MLDLQYSLLVPRDKCLSVRSCQLPGWLSIIPQNILPRPGQPRHSSHTNNPSSFPLPGGSVWYFDRKSNNKIREKPPFISIPVRQILMNILALTIVVGGNCRSQWAPTLGQLNLLYQLSVWLPDLLLQGFHKNDNFMTHKYLFMDFYDVLYWLRFP